MNPKTMRYILKRLLLAILTVWVVITVTFFVMRAVPGGPFMSEKAITPAAQAALEAKYGLDKPLLTQYGTYLKDIVTKFDFGPSLKQRGQSVITIISRGLKVSLRLGVIAAFSALLVGVILGSIAALRRNKIVDRVIMVITTAFVSMPSFIMGTLLLVLFAIKWMILPANGSTGAGLVLPIITLALYPMAYITRLTRSSMLDVLGQDYIRTARAKGLPEWAVVWKHGFRTALLPVVTTILNHIPHIIGGSLVVERIFGWPGMGSLLFTSVSSRDYTVIMGLTVVIALTVLATGILMDLVYRLVDPGVGWGGEGR